MTGQDTGVSTCQHCGQRIVLTNYALGPEWDHQPQGASFADSRSRYCETTKAEPASLVDVTSSEG